jgi:hypothetical protein
LEQALQKAELRPKATSDFVPALTTAVAAEDVVVCTKPLLMVLYSAEDRMATLSVSLTYTPRLAMLCKRK